MFSIQLEENWLQGNEMASLPPSNSVQGFGFELPSDKWTAKQCCQQCDVGGVCSVKWGTLNSQKNDT